MVLLFYLKLTLVQIEIIFLSFFFVNSLNKVIYAKLVSKGHQICTFAFQLFSAYFQLNKILKDMIFVHINMILPVLNFRINENM